MAARFPLHTVCALTLLPAWLGLVTPTNAGFILEQEANNTLATAQSVDSGMTSESQAFIQDSTTLPHATVIGTGDGTFDYFSFTVGAPGAQGIFDVDLALPLFSFNPVLFLFSPTGALIATNDTMAGPVDSGSFLTTDPYLTHTFTQAGVYTIGVAQSGATAGQGILTGQGPAGGSFYLLNISVEDTAVPEPGTLILFGTGLAGVLYRERRKRAAAKKA